MNNVEVILRRSETGFPYTTGDWLPELDTPIRSVETEKWILWRSSYPVNGCITGGLLRSGA
jgi:hypothetical protein